MTTVTLKKSPRVNLPFQVIETIKESSRLIEEKKKQRLPLLFDIYGGTEVSTHTSL